MKFLSDIEVEEGLRDKDGGLGADGQILSSTGSLTSWIDATSGSIGGSIADNQIAVGASTANTIEGSSNFTYTGSVFTVKGRMVLSDDLTTAAPNIYMGKDAGINSDLTGSPLPSNNIGIGRRALEQLTQGGSNIAIGAGALRSATENSSNVAIGGNALFYLDGVFNTSSYNTVIGTAAGQCYGATFTLTDFVTTGSENVFLGWKVRPLANNPENQIIIGYDAVGGGDNTITLGNGDITTFRIPGLNATNNQVLTYNATAGGFKAAAAAGGGGIGGATVATQVAFGATSSTTEIISDSALFYSNLNGLTIGDAAINGSNAILNLNKGEGGTGRIVMKKLGVSKFDLKLDGSEDAYITAVNTLTITTTQPSGVTKDIILNPTGSVGVGDTSPSSKLSVAGGIQMANDGETSTTNSDKAGTLRYREVTNIGTPKASNSYIDMYMRTEDSTYEWVNIVTNNW